MGDVDRKISVLIEEYKIHKEDMYRHATVYTNSIAYMQVLGIFISTVFFYLFTQKIIVDELPDSIKLTVLLLGSALIFYFFSTVTSSVYMFFILRRRMSDIETRINTSLNASLIIYESQMAPVFFERAMPINGILNPLSVQALFRLALFGFAIFLLIVSAGFALHTTTAIFYIVTVVFISAYLYFTFFKLYLTGQKNFSFDHLSIVETSQDTPFVKLLPWLLNYFITIFIFWLYFADGIMERIMSTTVHYFERMQMIHDAGIYLAIFIYTGLCALFLPTPSEAPILFFDYLPFFPLFIAAAIGRSVGATGLALLVRAWSDAGNQPPRILSRHFARSPTRGVWRSRWASLLYLLFQSIPFFPMRTSTMVYAWGTGLGAKNVLWIVVANMVGTPLRMSLMWMLVSLGVLVLDPILRR